MEKEVVSNSSSLIFLAKLDLFILAKNVIHKLLIPKAVMKELFQKNSPEVQVLKKELNTFIHENDVRNLLDLPIDEGEKEAISLCVEKKISVFLSDDKKARMYARSLGIKTLGVLGILLSNLEEKKISKEKFLQILNKLVEQGYYISPALYAEVIRIINERE